MADSFKLEILVPSGKLLEEDVTSVTVKTAMGEVGILPHHASYTALLDTGIIMYSGAGSSRSERLVVSGGFLNFADNKLQVLADAVDTSDKVKGAQYDSERSALDSALKDADTQTPEWQLNRRKLDRIEAIDILLSQAHKGSLN